MKLNYNKVAPWFSLALIGSGVLIGVYRGGYLLDLRFSAHETRVYIAPTIAPDAPVASPEVLPVPVATPALVAPVASPAVAPEPETMPDYGSLLSESKRSAIDTLLTWVGYLLPVSLAFYVFSFLAKNIQGRKF